MYQAQVRCIRQEINRETRDRPFKAIKYELNTVVKYQGKEKPIILVSMVRNFGPNASMRRRSSRANVARFEYINVAFSRAQELLVIFGARDTFAPYKVELPPMDATGSPIEVAVYREICDAIERNGAVKQATALGELPKIETRKMQR
jgi:superfamily I DNA and/or RNA helicase